jgi:hypothetical protein
MDDNYDTHKTANIEINQIFCLNASLISLFNFLNCILLVKVISLTALHRTSYPICTFAPVKSFIHVSVFFCE